MTVVPFGPVSLPQLQRHLDTCLVLLRHLQRLLDAYVVDFFTASHWRGTLSEKWREALEAMSPADLADWMDVQAASSATSSAPRQGTTPYPLGMLALRQSLISLSLPRKPCNDVSCVTRELNLGKRNDGGDVQREWRSFDQEFTENALHNSSLGHIFRRHVKPKKQHEIARVAELSCAVVGAGNRRLVDVGSGVGHLSRLLAHRHGFRVACLDTEPDFTAAAKKFDADLGKLAAKWGRDVGSPPEHVTCRITHKTSAAEFDSKLQEKFGKDGDYALVGLHSCGDLGPSILRLFASPESAAKTLLSAGCCYMKMEKLFPLSKHWKSKSLDEQCWLSYVARELSCHAIEVYCQRLREGQADKLRVHCYRSLLEKLLQDKDSEMKHAGLRTVARAEALPFAEYARKATSQIKIGKDKNAFCMEWADEEFETEFVKGSLDRWWQVVSFYSIRLSLAPLVETVLLLDRCIYLSENGISGVIAAVFDPTKSPRNHIIVATKK